MRTLHRAFAAVAAALTVIWICAAAPSRADEPYRVSSTSRIKDLANIEGVRQNQLIGYGLSLASTAPATPSTTSRSPGNRCKPCSSGSA
jgi:hypothetical protein